MLTLSRAGAGATAFSSSSSSSRPRVVSSSRPVVLPTSSAVLSGVSVGCRSDGAWRNWASSSCVWQQHGCSLWWCVEVLLLPATVMASIGPTIAPQDCSHTLGTLPCCLSHARLPPLACSAAAADAGECVAAAAPFTSVMKWTMMRHGNRLKHLGRPADQRKALIRGLVTEVLRHGQIRTTKVRAVPAAVAGWRQPSRLVAGSSSWQARGSNGSTALAAVAVWHRQRVAILKPQSTSSSSSSRRPALC